MRYYKETSNDYLLSIGVGNGFEEITEAEYNEILTVIHNKPIATDTTDYRLREDLTWESYEREPEPVDDDIDEAEAFDIIFGGGAE